MYSRYTSTPRDNGYRVPEHYSGCAFAAPQKEGERQGAEPPHPATLPKTKVSPSYTDAAPHPFPPPPAAPHPQAAFEPTAEPLRPPKDTEQAPCEQNRTNPKKEAVLPGAFGQLLSNIGVGLPFSNGIDFDSLLLLGLILLLAGDGGDTELLLLLTLLLFCS